MLISIIVITIILIAISFIGLMIYRKLHKDEYTREKYAFACLAACASLVTMLGAQLFSKKGILDHFSSMISAAFGNAVLEPAPPSATEEILFTGVVSFAIYFIMRSHQDWSGGVSANEIEQKRLHRSTTLFSQGLQEGLRLIRREADFPIGQPEKRRRADIRSPSEDQLVSWVANID